MQQRSLIWRCLPTFPRWCLFVISHFLFAWCTICRDRTALGKSRQCKNLVPKTQTSSMSCRERMEAYGSYNCLSTITTMPDLPVFESLITTGRQKIAHLTMPCWRAETEMLVIVSCATTMLNWSSLATLTLPKKQDVRSVVADYH